MTVVSIVLMLAAGTPTSEVMQAASDCSIGNIVIGAPSRLAWLLDESDLPVIVTETVVMPVELGCVSVVPTSGCM